MITVDMVELITAADVRIGDTLVHFTPIMGHIITPPTQRQLNLRRTRWVDIDAITPATTARGVDIIDFNGGAVDNPTTGASYLPTANVWRVKR